MDWAGRAGNYTFEQAVAELGPPDWQTKLTDGSRVADWLTRRRRNAIYTTGDYGIPGWPSMRRAKPGQARRIISCAGSSIPTAD